MMLECRHSGGALAWHSFLVACLYGVPVPTVGFTFNLGATSHLVQIIFQQSSRGRFLHCSQKLPYLLSIMYCKRCIDHISFIALVVINVIA
jgi:hypothetical protein